MMYTYIYMCSMAKVPIFPRAPGPGGPAVAVLAAEGLCDVQAMG